MSDSGNYEDSGMEEEDELEDMSVEEEDDEDYFDTSTDAFMQQRKRQYVVLNTPEIKQRQAEVVESVTSVLGISAEDAARILRKYKWDANRVHEEWFSDNDRVRAAVGMVDEAPEPPGTSDKCMICFEVFPRPEMRAAACKHGFCVDCWGGYIGTAVAGGPSVLDLRCPLPDCKAEVPVGLVSEVLLARPPTRELLPRYEAFALRSFVEDNRSLVWCTGANCDNAVECRVDRHPNEPLDVLCSGCGATFCFNCKEEAHRPVSCETVRRWVTKNSAESENLNWILANTKPCPKCCRPIEKNQGCMHMTCSQCRHEFCWLCNGTWSEHGERTGGFYACNRYEAAKKVGEYDAETRRRENAKHSLERYMHYFERWDAHNKAREKARKDAALFASESLERLSDMTKTPTSQLKFIMDAWAQVIECRRVLKWTYAYGYYAFEGEEDPDAPATTAAALAARRQFFEFLQGDAERILDQLHEAAEIRLKALREEAEAAAQAAQLGTSAGAGEAAGSDDEVDTGGAGGSNGAAGSTGVISADKFQEFRKNLIGLTDVTHNSFDKLVAQLERGFEDMDKRYASHVIASQDDSGAGPSSSGQAAAAAAAAGGGGAGSSGQAAAAAAAAGDSGAGSSRGKRPHAGAGSSSSGAAREPGPDDDGGHGDGGGGGGGEEVDPATGELVSKQGFWTCPHCTVMNADISSEACEVCNLPRH